MPFPDGCTSISPPRSAPQRSSESEENKTADRIQTHSSHVPHRESRLPPSREMWPKFSRRAPQPARTQIVLYVFPPKHPSTRAARGHCSPHRRYSRPPGADAPRHTAPNARPALHSVHRLQGRNHPPAQSPPEHNRYTPPLSCVHFLRTSADPRPPAAGERNSGCRQYRSYAQLGLRRSHKACPHSKVQSEFVAWMQKSLSFSYRGFSPPCQHCPEKNKPKGQH